MMPNPIIRSGVVGVWLCMVCLSEGDRNANPLVLIVAYDGLRWDFITPQLTPFLWNVSQNGVFAPHGIKNQVYTKTAPNFLSISTGLYEENHGVLSNTMWDPEFEAWYDVWNFWNNEARYNDSLDAKWYNGTPIWQVNDGAEGGRVTGAMRWPLCEIRANNARPMKHCVPWNGTNNLIIWKQEIDTLIQWFTDPEEPINFGLYYNPEPDHTEHGTSIYSDSVKTLIRQLDSLAEYMFQELDKAGLLQDINIIFTSDHGMTDVKTDYDVVKLPVPSSNYYYTGMSYFPRGGITEEELYDALYEANQKNPKYHLFRKKDFPSAFRFKNHRRVGPVIVQPYDGVYITGFGRDTSSWRRVFADHSYLNTAENMRPFFLATGPGLKKKHRLDWSTEAENIDLYSLMCRLLGLPIPPNDGDISRIASILA